MSVLASRTCVFSDGRLSWRAIEEAPAPDFGSANLSGGSPRNEDARLTISRAAGGKFTNDDQPGVRLAKAAAAQSAEPVRSSKRTVSAKAVPGKTANATEKKR
jgi:hypothetical protein